ncbi:MAG: hypothetical protein ACFFE4_00395 [Candidatus Thorarchaeota archaeon]
MNQYYSLSIKKRNTKNLMEDSIFDAIISNKQEFLTAMNRALKKIENLKGEYINMGKEK